MASSTAAGITLAGFHGNARLFFASAPVDTTSGTETGQYAHPFFLSAYSEYRTQYIYLPSEVGAAGRIETIACNVSNALGALNNFTGRFKHTTKASYTGTGQAVWESTGWTTVYQAKALAGTKTKRETVDFALRELIRRRQAKDILELRGKIVWEGDLDEMRANRF